MKDIVQKIDFIIEASTYGNMKSPVFMKLRSDILGAQNKKKLEDIMQDLPKYVKKKDISDAEMMKLIDYIDDKSMKVRA